MERFFLHFSNIGMFCLVIVAFFVLVATEYSLLNCRSGLIEEEESEHKFGASAALLLLRQLEKSILTVQFLIILFSIFLGWWGSGIIDFYVKRIFSKIVQDWPILSSSIFTLLISFIAMLYLIMVFGWLISKSVAAKYPEKTLRFFALPVLCCVWLFTPILFIIMGSANLILKCFGLSTEVEPSKVHSPEELAELVTQSTESGELGKEEEEMLHGVIGLSDTVAREVMTPRTDLVTVPINASLEEVVSIVIDSNFSRLPVIDKTVDNVLGILLAKDLLPYFATNTSSNARQQIDFNLKKIIREAYFVPNTKPINDLLSEFKHRKLHLAVVLDQHGGVDGIVTLEDLIEEIIGDIFDESDVPESKITVCNNGEIIVDGGVLVCDLNNRFDLTIPEGDYDTVAGFIYSALGRVPSEGEKIEVFGNQVLTAEETNEENNSNGNFEPQSSVQTEEAEGQEEKKQKARVIIIVEKVDGYRIESVRLKVIMTKESAESDTKLLTSEGGTRPLS